MIFKVYLPQSNCEYFLVWALQMQLFKVNIFLLINKKVLLFLTYSKFFPIITCHVLFVFDLMKKQKVLGKSFPESLFNLNFQYFVGKFAKVAEMSESRKAFYTWNFLSLKQLFMTSLSALTTVCFLELYILGQLFILC